MKPIPSLTEQDIARFWSHVDRRSDDECWLWTGTTNPDGYGRVHLSDALYQAHRTAFRVSRGYIDDALDVLHSCDNPSCCNPRHLFQGTHTDNMRDMTAKGRNVAQAHPERIPRGAHHHMRLHPEHHWSRANHPELADARRGAGNPAAKLTPDQVELIRNLRAQGVHQRDVAAMFGISKSQVARIEHHQSW